MPRAKGLSEMPPAILARGKGLKHDNRAAQPKHWYETLGFPNLRSALKDQYWRAFDYLTESQKLFLLQQKSRGPDSTPAFFLNIDQQNYKALVVKPMRPSSDS